jgi:hypothetical protein
MLGKSFEESFCFLNHNFALIFFAILVRKMPIKEFHLKKILDGLGFTHEQVSQRND